MFNEALLLVESNTFGKEVINNLLYYNLFLLSIATARLA